MTLNVFLDVKEGKIVCMCLRSHKKCRKRCERAEVTYDQYKDMEECFRQNRYGK